MQVTDYGYDSYARGLLEKSLSTHLADKSGQE